MKNEYPWLIVGGASLVGAVVLICTGHTVPVEMWALASGALGGGLGITAPSASSLETAVSGVLQTLGLESKPAASVTERKPAASSEPVPAATAPTAGVPPAPASSPTATSTTPAGALTPAAASVVTS